MAAKRSLPLMVKLHTMMSDTYIALVKKGTIMSLLNLTESGINESYYALKDERNPDSPSATIKSMIFDAVRYGGKVVTFYSSAPFSAIIAMSSSDPESFSQLIANGDIVYSKIV